MILEILLLSMVGVSPSYNSVVKNFIGECKLDEFRCSDGSCIPLSGICDGRPNCYDGFDEHECDYGFSRVSRSSDLWTSRAGFSHDLWNNSSEPWAYRKKRQSRCTNAQWQCQSGQCIDSDGKCDGVRNCADGSDESHAMCRKQECPDHLFRCTYGACIDGYGKCDNITNCVDNSDELHPDCRPNIPSGQPGQFKCSDGSSIPTTQRCDGRADCADGSDETVSACGATRCHSTHLFQCAYGACVDAGSDCDNKQDCADGSDEADDLCNRQGSGSGQTRPTQSSVPTPPASTGSGNCILPPYPEHGSYTVISSNPNAVPGTRVPSAQINIVCDPGFMPSSNHTSLLCLGSSGWTPQVPTCIKYCILNPHRSVTYHCLVQNTSGGTQVCPQKVPQGTRVRPACNTPNYYSRLPTLPYMTCLDGQFDYISTCEPECGKVTPEGESYVINGWATRRGEFPWHVGVYRKDITPYMQICGGSIVSSNLIISAAHCFYTDAEKLRPPNKYAVAAGKLYRPWNDPNDKDAQKRDVSDIKIPERYRGSINNYQEDIALVFVSIRFDYVTYVRPVCIDFDPRFNSDQLSPGQVGRVTGWGLTKEDGKASPILLTVNLPFIPAGKCIDESPNGFQEYISGDKFCAGFTNGTSVCKGDSGGGLVFSARGERLTTRYYLRGIVSTGPKNLEFTSCDSHYYTTFTMIQHFQDFIQMHYDLS